MQQVSAEWPLCGPPTKPGRSDLVVKSAKEKDRENGV